MKSTKKHKVLFICTANSARSQLAEALLKHKAGDRFDVYSAGTHPDKVDTRTIEALKKYGLSSEGLTSKNLNIFEEQTFDYVISLCDKANNSCRSYPGAGKQLAWDFPDPKTRPGSHPFYTTLVELNNRLSMFLLVEQKSANSEDNAPIKASNQIAEELIDFDLISFYKSMTDSMRLKTLMLTHYHGELCVCELMEALKEDCQPKVSRNLAVLKKSKIITDRKHGQWVFYRINPKLPIWAKSIVALTTENNVEMIKSELQCIDKMTQRPDKMSYCK